MSMYPETLYQAPNSWNCTSRLISEAEALELASLIEAGDLTECIEFSLIKTIGRHALYAGGWHDRCGDRRRWVCRVNGRIVESRHETVEEAE